MSRAYVYRVDLEALGSLEHLDELEVLVTTYPDLDNEQAPPEVAVRPAEAGIGLRVWGPPLELVRQS